MIDSTEAEKLAFKFLTSEWNVPLKDRDWFTVISSRTLGEDGYDDTGKCEPYYEFTSPIRDSETNSDLEDLPDWIAQVLIAERKHR